MTAAGRGLRVSVIVPTHERPQLCIRAVRSALAQTVPPHEVLVWDDGSSPETRRQLRRFAAEDARIQLHEGAPAGMPSVGRNRLIDLVRGDWVATLDDDDEWLPDKIERQQSHLNEWDVVGSAVRRRSNGRVYSPHVGPILRKTLYRDNVLVLSTVTMRRSFAARGFREDRELAGVEDYCMWLDLADAGARIAATPDVVAVYDDTGADRLSNDTAAVQRRLARHMLGRWRERPTDRDAAAGALVHATRAAKLRARARLTR